MVSVVSASAVVAELSLCDVDGVASVDILATFDGVVESASVLLFFWSGGGQTHNPHPSPPLLPGLS